MNHLLTNTDRSMVKTDPFPHIIIEDVLPECDELISKFPGMDVFMRVHGGYPGQNKRMDMGVKEVRESNQIAPIWKEFIELNSSQEFLDKIIEIFKPDIEERYPQILAFRYLERGIRGIDSRETHDVLLNASISMNTPVTKKSSPRGPHVDDPRKFCSGLYYLPQLGDTAGGDLILYKYKGKKKRFYQQQIDPKYVEEFARVPFKKNTAIFFLNTIDSIHGVSQREVTDTPRTFANFTAEGNVKLFDMDSLQEGRVRKKIRKLMGEFD